MTIKEIIDGLKFAVAMFLFDPDTGETYVEPRNDMDKTTIDACKGAIELLEQTRWIPVSERLPEDGRPVLIYAWNVHHVIARYDEFRTANGYKKTWVTADAWNGNTEINHEVIAWMPLPSPFEPQESEVSE